MRCLVADDDPLVCETIESWLDQIDGVDFCLKAEDGLTALNILSAGGFDLVFLDLQMPGLDGETLLRSLSHSIPVIVISASEEFGARSYEFNVVDYLVKPVTFPRVHQAVQRARERMAAKAPAAPDRVEVQDDTLFVKDGTRIVKVDLRRLLYIRAEANYVSFVSEGQQVMSLMSMKRAEEILPEPFLRVHRSWIVNRNRIQRVEDGNVIIGDQKIPVGESYREALIRRLGVVS